ncbi:MAG: WbuC family cupin fold metalloprotein [Planctomycetes bacterium]|nr:WbuC family cupin fold metalloprotein [Planctomycetota bacterium]
MNRVDLARLARLSEAARQHARLRLNENLHAMEDPIHRLLNATEPGTYIQPHRHLDPPKLETLGILRGRGALLVFDDRGGLVELARLSPEGPDFMLELPPGTWHSLVALEPGTVWFEVKAGPYSAPVPADIAPWAPAPGTAEAPRYLEHMLALVR